MTIPLLSIKNLRVNFRLDRKHVFEALKGISFDLALNQTVALVGESGSGKSVASLAVLGLLPKENGSIDKQSIIEFDGKNLLLLSNAEKRQLRGTQISMIFQEPMSSLNPVFTVGYQIGEILKQHKKLSGKMARDRTIELLTEVGISDPSIKIDSYPHELSGGQQQRVMIAIAIACEPKLLIADEPTTALDVTIQKQILELIASLQKKRGMSVLFITHDLAVVSDIADRVVVMRNGEIREQGFTRDVFASPTDHYTRALLACRPVVGTRPKRLPVIDDFMAEHVACATGEERLRGVRESDPVVLDVRGLGKDFVSREGLFGKRVFHAAQDVSFKLRKGKTLGLVGESGSGKTTVGLTIMRLHQTTYGEAWFNGKNIFALSEHDFLPLKRRIQIIFQNPYASLNPRFTVGQIICEPMTVHGIGANTAERVSLAFELLNKVGLPEISFCKYPHEFSGGQRQRISIARALTMQPEILICDESVSALDVSIQAQILNLLQDLQDEYGLSYIFISHDLAVVKYMSDEIMVMHEGRVIEQGNADEIFTAPREMYTRKLLESIPKGLSAHA